LRHGVQLYIVAYCSIYVMLKYSIDLVNLIKYLMFILCDCTGLNANQLCRITDRARPFVCTSRTGL